jgi:hypothetical protein
MPLFLSSLRSAYLAGTLRERTQIIPSNDNRSALQTPQVRTLKNKKRFSIVAYVNAIS